MQAAQALCDTNGCKQTEATQVNASRHRHMHAGRTCSKLGGCQAAGPLLSMSSAVTPAEKSEGWRSTWAASLNSVRRQSPRSRRAPSRTSRSASFCDRGEPLHMPHGGALMHSTGGKVMPYDVRRRAPGPCEPPHAPHAVPASATEASPCRQACLLPAARCWRQESRLHRPCGYHVMLCPTRNCCSFHNASQPRESRTPLDSGIKPVRLKCTTDAAPAAMLGLQPGMPVGE